MTVYKKIYKFSVIDEIAAGKQVHMLDRQNLSVALLNDMDAQSAVKITNSVDDANRYDFWICVESEDTEE